MLSVTLYFPILIIKRKMSLLTPPQIVRGMTVLNRDAFNKTISIPIIDASAVVVPWSKILPSLKKFLLKMDNLKPVFSADSKKIVLLNPDLVKSFNDLETEYLSQQGINENNFSFQNIVLKYENWKINDILKSVLPPDQEGLAGYSRIGHIVHLNLREHLTPYKLLIGQVLLDKCANCKTVVNKTQTIDNTYRNFQMELLCGEDNYLVQVKEHGIPFEFDFSSVYWNPRLSSEHDRIVKKLKAGDVLYDVCAGVGPFSIPIAKKKCIVLANDLNPESYKWLLKNAEKNKVKSIKCFNKDARDFIRNDVKSDLLERWTNNFSNSIHLTMNLPAMAVEFLDVFHGLFQSNSELDKIDLCMPIVHVYCFIKAEEKHMELAQKLTEEHLGFELKNNLKEVCFVRNVSPNKEMMRVSFELTREILFNISPKRKIHDDSSENSDSNNSKRKCKQSLIKHIYIMI